MIITNIKCDNQVKGWKVRSSRRLRKVRRRAHIICYQLCPHVLAGSSEQRE